MSSLFFQAEDGIRDLTVTGVQTCALVLFDDDKLYLACRCWERHPERMVLNEMRRDSPNLRNNDNFAVALDTFHDRRNAFLFSIIFFQAEDGIRDLTVTGVQTCDLPI